MQSLRPILTVNVYLFILPNIYFTNLYSIQTYQSNDTYLIFLCSILVETKPRRILRRLAMRQMRYPKSKVIKFLGELNEHVILLAGSFCRSCKNLCYDEPQLDHLSLRYPLSIGCNLGVGKNIFLRKQCRKIAILLLMRLTIQNTVKCDSSTITCACHT